jgi:NAD(P)-dependent dehydrogenase (short-subunit alcohol dehydrogenase family)
VDLQLHGLKAVVTGGSSGIGAAIVRALAAEGCEVAFCARRPSGISAMLESAGSLRASIQGHSVDVTDSGQFSAWLASLAPFDIFVANVSALDNDWGAALHTDIQATVNATEAAIPILRQSPHAAITYIGSKAASLVSPGGGAYGPAKAAMVHHMRSLAARLLPAVRVNVVSPGDTLVPGGLWDQVRRDDPAKFEQVLKRNPMQRLATAEEIARVVAFISSPAASFVAGSNWYVDGGSTSHVQL